MTSVDEWAVLKTQAAQHGPEALSLVERVGPDRARELFWVMAERLHDGTATAFYGVDVDGRWTLYSLLEKELRRIDDEDTRRHRRRLDRDRLKFPSERGDEPD